MLQPETDLGRFHDPQKGYHSKVTVGDRQAGISLIYEPNSSSYRYNVYCLEMKLMKEILSCEYDYLEDAIINVNEELDGGEIIKQAEVPIFENDTVEELTQRILAHDIPWPAVIYGDYQITQLQIF